MVMIEITEDKFDDLYENIESMLRFGGKAMTCLDKMKHEKEDRYGERNRMPDYRGYGVGRHGMREHEDYEDMRHREERERMGRDYRGYGEEY